MFYSPLLPPWHRIDSFYIPTLPYEIQWSYMYQDAHLFKIHTMKSIIEKSPSLSTFFPSSTIMYIEVVNWNYNFLFVYIDNKKNCSSNQKVILSLLIYESTSRVLTITIFSEPQRFWGKITRMPVMKGTDRCLQAINYILVLFPTIIWTRHSWGLISLLRNS